MPILQVHDLKVSYRTNAGWLKAVDGASFEIGRGESLGVLGESGCGKTTLALAIMGILPRNAEVLGRIEFEGTDLLSLSSDLLRQMRWKKFSMIFQAAMNALNPVYRVGSQLMDVYAAKANGTKDQARKRVTELFDLVGLDRKRMNSYPHELSGGMKQRVIIAMSLLCNPSLIIADEPTTALDVVIQDQILGQMRDLQSMLSFSIIVISHDVSVIAETCKKVAVMYAGKIFETGSVSAVIREPRNPYTISLMSSIPSVRGPRRRLPPITGAPPNLTDSIEGCAFHPRCPHVQEMCRQSPPPYQEISENHYSRCHFRDLALTCRR
jgi:peptide/nickel transport system ATP-binding protein